MPPIPIKVTIICKIPFNLWAQEKVFAKIEQCVKIKHQMNAEYFAKHCWNLNSLQKGLKSALRIEVSGNVDFSFNVKMKGTSSKTADQLEYYFGKDDGQYKLKIPKEDIEADFDPVKNKEVKVVIIGEEGKAELERVILSHDNKKLEIITAFKDGNEIKLENLRQLTLPEQKIFTSDLKNNLGVFVNNTNNTDYNNLSEIAD